MNIRQKAKKYKKQLEILQRYTIHPTVSHHKIVACKIIPAEDVSRNIANSEEFEKLIINSLAYELSRSEEFRKCMKLNSVYEPYNNTYKCYAMISLITRGK